MLAYKISLEYRISDRLNEILNEQLLKTTQEVARFSSIRILASSLSRLFNAMNSSRSKKIVHHKLQAVGSMANHFGTK